jgi:dihydroorotate dehydrogenase
MFRVPAAGALINRMGFNNPGAEALAARLQGWKEAGGWPGHPVGINLGKSKDTPLEGAAEDYARSFRALWGLADFFVVNVSSPNTPNLRQLQERGALEAILQALQDVNRELAGARGNGVGSGGMRPVLVKVAPDLSLGALDEVVELALGRGIAGVVATNTTIERPSTERTEVRARLQESGGLSGAPLRARSTELIRHIHKGTGGRLPIIGVGGIMDVRDAWEKVMAGASLLQVYTGLVYEGPGLVKGLVEGLRERLGEVGAGSLAEVVGGVDRPDPPAQAAVP